MPRPHASTTLLHATIKAWARAARARHPGYLRIDGPLEPRPEERFVQAGELRLHCLSWTGTGTPVVLVHGLNNTGWIWARPGAGLAADGRRVLAPTQRGHGASDKRDDLSLEATSADLEALLDAEGLDRVHLAGHSWGGKVAMHFAATRPARLRSLVLADPAPPGGLHPLVGHRRSVHAAFRPERGTYPDEASMRAQMELLLHHQVGDETDREAWGAIHERRPDGGYRAALSDDGFDAILRDAIQADITPLLPGVACPVLLLLPRLSLTTGKKQWAAARAAWPSLEERRVVGDHTFVHTNPGGTLAALRPFLARIEAS
jgi:pimeloyl-ACP methyl ester carboxylesterase